MNPDIISHEALTHELAGFYELSIGDYRVVYEILHAEQMLVIHTIGHRRDIGSGKKGGGKYSPLPLFTGAPPVRTSHGLL
jgi:hypothetical protein